MIKNILKGLQISIGFFLGCFILFGVVYAVGFHTPDEILSGTFNGDFSFNGSISANSISSSNIFYYLGRGTNFNYSNLNGMGSYWVDGGGTNVEGPTGSDTGYLLQFDNIQSAPNTFRQQFAAPGSGVSGLYWRSEYNGNWNTWNKILLENSNGRVGIGTANPNSKLEVAGTIHSTTGGIKFPDNTVQTTAASNINELTKQLTTSGTSKTFTIPSGALRIKILINGISSNANSQPHKIRLGDSGGIETTGYLGRAFTAGTHEAFSTDFHFPITIQSDAANVFSGSVTLDKLQGTNTWVAQGIVGNTAGTNQATMLGGSKTLTAELTTIEIFTSATFDAGEVSVTWE